MACKNAKAACPYHQIYQPESKTCMTTGCYNQRALDPTGGMDNPDKSYEYCSRYCARTSGRLPEEQTTDELCGGCSPAPDCAVINCYNTAWFDKRKHSFSLGCTRSHTEHAELSYSSCRALAPRRRAYFKHLAEQTRQTNWASRYVWRQIGISARRTRKYLYVIYMKRNSNSYSTLVYPVYHLSSEFRVYFWFILAKKNRQPGTRLG